MLPGPSRHLLLLLIIRCIVVPNVFAGGAPVPSNSREAVLLAPKQQKELAKALEALRDNKLPEARKRLDAVYRVAPSDTETNFLLGVYWSQMQDWAQARSFLEKVL